MIFQMLSGAIALCLVIAIGSSFFATTRRTKKGSPTGTLQSFLLANGNLTTMPVVSLLVSSSFALNGIFYQVWLGYSVGAWGLVAQIAWGASYFLLARHVRTIRQARSLHDLLGGAFGPRVRVVAALCSVLGFCAMMGWEIAISRQTFGEFVLTAGEADAAHASAAGAWISAVLVFGCLIYTIYGGLKGNSIADLFQNIVKLAGFGLVTALLILWLFSSGRSLGDYGNALFPSLSVMESRLGYFGLVTNIVFSLAWQFVDASTWQSILASSNREEAETKRDLRLSGCAVVIAPGLLGTLLGATLAFSPGITADNVLFKAIAIVGTDPTVLFVVFLAIACCVMSLVDGLLLGSGYALVVDVAHSDKTLAQIDANPDRAGSLLVRLRIVLIVLGVVAAWGVHSLLGALGTSLFSFVYLVIIPQLAILGPVLAALLRRTSGSGVMLFAIVAAFAAGLISTFAGQASGFTYLADGAGTITAAVSLILAFALSRRVAA